jgi:uncharacterized membrane protein required for colicin V production
MTASALDIGIVGMIVLGALWGLRSGGIRLAGPFVLIAGSLILRQSYPEIVDAFRNQPKLPTMLVFKLAILVALMAYGVFARYIHRAVHASGLGIVNRLAGVVLGAVTALLVAGFGLWLGISFAGEETEAMLAASQLGPAALQIFALLTLIAEHLA